MTYGSYVMRDSARHPIKLHLMLGTLNAKIQDMAATARDRSARTIDNYQQADV